MKITTIACCGFVALTVYCLSQYGTEWDLSGRYCMPTTLLAPDGQHYRDGSEVDFVTLALVNRGIEQEFWLVAVGVQLVLLMLLVRAMRRLHRTQMEAFELELRRIHGMRRADERK